MAESTDSVPGAEPAAGTPPQSLYILPSNQSAVVGGHAAGSTSSVSSPVASHHPGADNVARDGGPLRHPKPITPAEMHAQFEQEQEAVVNKLSRELAHLRASQNASVASNASSNFSASVNEVPPPVDSHLLSGPAYMTPSRRHTRSSSNASSRSTTGAIAGSVAATPSADPRGRAPLPIPISRQSSSASRQGHLSSPVPSGAGSYIDPSFANFQQQRAPLTAPLHGGSMVATHGSSTEASTPVGGSVVGGSIVGGTGGDPQQSPGLISTPRYEETAHYRAELEAAKRENDMLKKRVRELERMVRERRPGDADAGGRGHGRSESASTSTSVGTSHAPAAPTPASTGASSQLAAIAPPRDRNASTLSVAGSVGVGVPEEEVEVGESAASAGLGTLNH